MIPKKPGHDTYFLFFSPISFRQLLFRLFLKPLLIDGEAKFRDMSQIALFTFHFLLFTIQAFALYRLRFTLYVFSLFRETLFRFTVRFLDEDSAQRFSHFAELRNILSHEYLDIKWEKIIEFIKDASRLYPQFIEKAKELVKSEEK